MTPAEMIAHLQAAGLSQKAIADRVQCSQPTVHRIAKGANPGYALGLRIEALHAQEQKPVTAA